ncbi:MAG: hypothetical protein FVQ82_05280 [Planctomycetes bacterium]|nr:hypothetical protein [Planctomycetota bacterium]
MEKKVVRVEETLDETVISSDGPTPEEPSNDEVSNTDGESNVPQELGNEVCSAGSGEDEVTETNPSTSNYDVYEVDGYYYKQTVGHKPQLKIISNFTLQAKAEVVFNGNWFYRCVLVKPTGQEYEIDLFRDHFLSATAFKRAVSVKSNCQYYGNNYDTTQIQGLLADQNPPTVTGTDKNGIHIINDRLVYVEGDHVVDKDGPASDIVYINKNSQAHRIPNLLSQPDISQADIKAIACDIFGFNDSTIVFPVLGFIGYCFGKESITSKVGKHNPFMMLHGASGSGKSKTIEDIIIPIFSSRFLLANIADETQFTLGLNSSFTNMTPVCYDEYKNAVLTPSLKRMVNSTLLATYAQTPIERGRADQTIVSRPMTAPFILAGEMTIDSTSLDHRRIDVFYSKSKRIGTEDNFKRLIKQPLGAFGKALLYHTLQLGTERLRSEYDKQEAKVDPSIDDRFRDNAAVIRTGLWLMIDYLESKGIAVDSYQQGYEIIDSVIQESMNAANISTVDKIISDFCTMANDGVLVNRVDYEVKDNCLRLKIRTVYSKYERWARRNGTSECIGKRSFLQQIADEDFYIENKTMRIGGKSCNAISLDLSIMPDDMDINWPGYHRIGLSKEAV